MKKVLSTVAEFGVRILEKAAIRKRIIYFLVGGGIAIGGVNLPPETVEQIVTIGLSVWASM